ncbi:unnamed protein product [Schistosoma curassoni]|uniref:Uncharacterized protein n=1 Tax=Schistosoma curassoni TaxID=6186 RepID=A0A183JIE5_9TREM|nr:unnamed protein product [Schistosoma curassoni]
MPDHTFSELKIFKAANSKERLRDGCASSKPLK